METIIAGRFDTWEKAEETTQALLNAKAVGKEDICTFYVGPPGHHASYPIGGDQHTDPDAGEAHNKSIVGGAVGAGLAGLATLPAGPAAAATGAVVGAYAGSLVGSLQGMHEKDDHPHQAKTMRSAGVMLATKINAATAAEAAVVHILRQQGAQDIEKTEGEWRNGEWADFDPVAPPRLLDTGKS